jgi:hypothetical protein
MLHLAKGGARERERRSLYPTDPYEIVMRSWLHQLLISSALLNTKAETI